MKNGAKAASAAPATQPAHFRCGAGGCAPAESGVDGSVLISSSPFFSEAVDEVRVDAVGVQGASHQVAGTHPGAASPLAERHSGPGGAGGVGHHLNPLQRALYPTGTE